jgi:hypothetical protein
MMDERRTITTIIVAHGPRPHPLPKTTDEVGYPAEWNVDLGRPRGRPEDIVGPVLPDREVTQTFVCEDDELAKVEVMIALYARVNHCHVAMELREESPDGPMLASEVICADRLRDNNWWRVEFPRIENARGRRFALVLKSTDSTIDNCVTAYYTSAQVPGRETLRVGRHERPGNVLHFHTWWSKDSADDGTW